ncbi:protein kinase domain-containing protein, partial [Streptomyces longispororuber]|uniref:serine/threonine-protein kinase n=1 Tax=Streptomyces longispororuber TaxID=68230 RepID=UPI00167EB533
ALGQAVRRCGPLAVAAVRALGARLADALGAVHLAQVLHRDLKPGNVLLTPDGPRLIDFGIAQAFDATALTTAGMVVGTPGFMAPEQLLGSHAVVPASDVFALGAVLAYAACGRGPFDDQEIASVIFRITQGDADLSGVPEDDGLREAVAACLAPTPEDRPTAPELAGRLGGHGREVPWPAEVLSLFAEHREAVRRCEQDVLGQEFAAADTVTGGPGSIPRPPAPPPAPRAPTPSPAAPPLLGTWPPSPAARPAAAPPWSRPARRRPVWIAAAALAAGAVTVAALLLPGLGDGAKEARGEAGGGRTGGAASGGGGSGSPAGSGAGSARGGGPRVVTQHGNALRGGDHGRDGTRASARPEGWKPWTARRPKALDTMGDGCVLARTTLVCRDGKGAAAAFDAATGRHRWTSRGFDGAEGDLIGLHTVAPEADADGRAVYVPSELGVTKVDVATGARRWQQRAADESGVLAMAYARGVLYVAELRLGPYGPNDPPGSAVIRARSAADGRELWRSKALPKTSASLVVSGGRVFTALEEGGVVRLDARTGEVARRVAVDCGQLLLRSADAVLCWQDGKPGLRDLDPVTLRTRRVLAPGVTVSGPRPVVGAAGVLVVASGNDDPTVDHHLSGYDWRTGKRLWRYGAPTGLNSLALADDRVLSTGDAELRGLRLDGDVDTLRSKTVPSDPSAERIPGWARFSRPLYVGGAVFTTTSDGTVISGYAP